MPGLRSSSGTGGTCQSLVLIALATIVGQILKKRLFGDSSLSDGERMASGKVLAAWALIFWIGAITSGRFLAYTYTYVSYPG